MGTARHYYTESPVKKPLISLNNDSIVVGIMTRLELSKSLARTAVLLADGLTLEEISSAMQITLKSTRSYTKQIYSILNIHNQAQAVSLIWKIIAEANEWQI